MKDRINALLSHSAPLKAREIAKELGLDRSEVSSFLHNHPGQYRQDSEYRWLLAKERELELTLLNGWVNAEAFENVLKAAGPILDGPSEAIRIVFPSTCKTMIDCNARLLALVNQLASHGKEATLDFTDAKGTLTYLDRAGFFDLLHKDVTVLPNKPVRSAAKRHKGRSDTLVELGAVDPKSDNARLIEQLTDTFVQQSSADYKIAAFTIFSELIGNVSEHSESRLHGYAGLQKYKGNLKHIQTVVTDSGVGIASTLRSTLKTHHPELFRRFGATSVESDMGLVVAAMSKGGISRFGGGRGLGFKSSRELAVKFNASFSVRQEEFCLRFEYRNGQLMGVTRQPQLSRLMGTHICFDFYVA